MVTCVSDVVISHTRLSDACSMADVHSSHPYIFRWPKKLRKLRLTAKTPEPICMTFGTLQRHFVLNTSINSIFIRFITKWRHLARVSNLNFALDEISARCLAEPV